MTAVLEAAAAEAETHLYPGLVEVLDGSPKRFVLLHFTNDDMLIRLST